MLVCAKVCCTRTGTGAPWSCARTLLPPSKTRPTLRSETHVLSCFVFLVHWHLCDAMSSSTLSSLAVLPPPPQSPSSPSVSTASSASSWSADCPSLPTGKGCTEGGAEQAGRHHCLSRLCTALSTHTSGQWGGGVRTAGTRGRGQVSRGCKHPCCPLSLLPLETVTAHRVAEGESVRR